MTLYEIADQFLELMEMAEDETLDQAIIKDTLEGVECELEDKADSYAKIRMELQGKVDMITAEIERLAAKKATLSNNIKAITKNLENAMLATGKRKFKTNLFSFSIQKNTPAVKIDNEDAIPDEFYVPQNPKLDKRAVAVYLKENSCNWAHMEQTESLRIR